MSNVYILLSGTQNATTTPAQLNAGNSVACQKIVVQNQGAAAVNIGTKAVQGLQLAAGATSPILEVRDVSDLWIVAASGTQAVGWIAWR